jgi:hypothetical protein
VALIRVFIQDVLVLVVLVCCLCRPHFLPIIPVACGLSFFLLRYRASLFVHTDTLHLDTSGETCQMHLFETVESCSRATAIKAIDAA